MQELVFCVLHISTRRVPLVEQELLTLPGHLSSPPVFSGVRVTRSLVLYVVFPFVLFLLAIVFSVLLRYTDSDCPFGIFKLFLSTFVCSDEMFKQRNFFLIRRHSKIISIVMSRREINDIILREIPKFSVFDSHLCNNYIIVTYA